MVDFFNECVEKVMGRKYKVRTERRVSKFASGHLYNYVIYRVHFGSKNLYEMIKKGIDGFRIVVEKYPESFVRGFADAEGSVEHVWHPRIVISNNNLEILLYIQSLLSKFFSIDSKIYRGHGKIYRLKILTKESVRKFKDQINFVSKKKGEKLEKGWTI
jgi:intein-encoded DNA endonuclease-like protein